MKIRNSLAHFAAVVAAAFPAVSHAAIGTVQKVFNDNVSRLVADPFGPYVYGTVTDQNSVVVYNTDTLTKVATIPVGSNPKGMAISPDGTRLYVANSGANSVSVINLQTKIALPNLVVSVKPFDIQAGNNNQLYLLGDALLQQVSAVTGANSAPTYGAWDGQIRISGDRNTLLFGNTGLSPGHLDRYDLSSGTITITGGFYYGSNDRALALSNDGSFFGFASAASPYQIPIKQTSSFLTMGTLNLSGPPQLITLSPDDKLAYVSTVFVNTVQVFNLQTYLPIASFEGQGARTDLVTDHTGQQLFISGSTGVTVYSVPEPAAAAVLGIVGVMGLRRRNTRTR